METLTCPEPACGAPLALVTDGLIGERYHPGYHRRGTPLPSRWRAGLFLACTGCEFCVEVDATGNLLLEAV